jgi:hypothetical protein
VSWVDETGTISAGISHGNQNMYNIYYGCDNPSLNTVGLGLAIGIRWIFSSSWLSADINSAIEGKRRDIQQHFDNGAQKKQYDAGLSQVTGLRAMAGITFFDHLSVFAGGSVNTSVTYFSSRGNDESRPHPFTNYYFKKGSIGNKEYAVWPGVFAGLQYFL